MSNTQWIPDKYGNFHQPKDITEEILNSEFIYDNRNGWLTAIRFGESAIKRSEDYKAKNKKAREFGFESADKAKKWAELDKLGISPDEILAQHRPIELPENAVPNPERRRNGVLERQENAQSKESVTRERSIQPGIANAVARKCPSRSAMHITSRLFNVFVD